MQFVTVSVLSFLSVCNAMHFIDTDNYALKQLSFQLGGDQQQLSENPRDIDDLESEETEDFNDLQTEEANEAFSYEVCNDEYNTFTLDALVLSPTAPEIGQQLSVSVKGTLHERIEAGARIEFSIFWNRIRLIKKSVDACQELNGSDGPVKCPLEAGAKDVQVSFEVPKQLFKGKYRADVRVIDEHNHSVFCAKAYMKL